MKTAWLLVIVVLASFSALAEGPFEHYNIGWIKDDVSRNYVFKASVVDVDAPIEKVWALVKSVDRYQELSQNAMIAHIDGNLALGKIIAMDLAPQRFVGKLVPTSYEKVTVVDDQNKVVSWVRELPLGGGRTERYQVLIPLSESKTRSYIGLWIPGFFGAMTKCFLNGTILEAFESLQAGIKKEAEKSSTL